MKTPKKIEYGKLRRLEKDELKQILDKLQKMNRKKLFKQIFEKRTQK